MYVCLLCSRSVIFLILNTNKFMLSSSNLPNCKFDRRKMAKTLIQEILITRTVDCMLVDFDMVLEKRYGGESMCDECVIQRGNASLWIIYDDLLLFVVVPLLRLMSIQSWIKFWDIIPPLCRINSSFFLLLCSYYVSWTNLPNSTFIS